MLDRSTELMNERTKNILLYTVLAAVLLLLPLTAMTHGVVSVELQEGRRPG